MARFTPFLQPVQQRDISKVYRLYRTRRTYKGTRFIAKTTETQLKKHLKPPVSATARYTRQNLTLSRRHLRRHKSAVRKQRRASERAARRIEKAVRKGLEMAKAHQVNTRTGKQWSGDARIYPRPQVFYRKTLTNPPPYRPNKAKTANKAFLKHQQALVAAVAFVDSGGPERRIRW